jgi:hypothetical protein
MPHPWWNLSAKILLLMNLGTRGDNGCSIVFDCANVKDEEQEGGGKDNEEETETGNPSSETSPELAELQSKFHSQLDWQFVQLVRIPSTAAAKQESLTGRIQAFTPASTKCGRLYWSHIFHSIYSLVRHVEDGCVMCLRNNERISGYSTHCNMCLFFFCVSLVCLILRCNDGGQQNTAATNPRVA